MIKNFPLSQNWKNHQPTLSNKLQLIYDLNLYIISIKTINIQSTIVKLDQINNKRKIKLKIKEYKLVVSRLSIKASPDCMTKLYKYRVQFS